MKPLLQKAGLDKKDETNLEAVITDKGYDSQENNTFVDKDCKAAPIIPIREWKEAQLPDICNAKGCGLAMVYWGRDGNYLKYRCPRVLGKDECKSRFRCTSSPYGYVLKLPDLLHPQSIDSPGFDVDGSGITIFVRTSGPEFNVSKRLDCGIAMLHIEVAASNFGIQGAWELLETPRVSRFAAANTKGSRK
jgi:hypothetical protein